MTGRIRRAWRELCRSDAEAEAERLTQGNGAVGAIAVSGPAPAFEHDLQEIKDLHDMQRRPDLSSVRDLVDDEIRRAELSLLEWLYDNS